MKQDFFNMRLDNLDGKKKLNGNIANIVKEFSDDTKEEDKNCDKSEREQGDVSNNIEKFGQKDMVDNKKNNPRGNIYFLNIIGQIEGHTIANESVKTTKYEHVIPQLVAVAQDTEIDGMLILLNTVGGDVEAGLAIAELISKLGKPTVSLVIGGGHSIGVPLAVSADYSFIAESATMILHPVRVNGTVIGAPQTYDYFNKMQDRILNFISKHANVEKENVNKLMLDTSKLLNDVGTMLIGEEAVKQKIINEVGGLNDAMEKLYSMIGKNTKS